MLREFKIKNIFLILFFSITQVFALTPDCQNEMQKICGDKPVYLCDGLGDVCRKEAFAELKAKSRGGSSASNMSIVPTSQFGIVAEHRLEDKVSLAIPVIKELSTSLMGSRYHIDQQILDSKVVLPQNFYRSEVGINFMPTKTWGTKTTLGYSSDEMFKSSRDLVFSLIAHYREEGSSIAYTLFISNNNSIANYIPIPGFIYFYKAGNLSGIFGLPFASLQWTPVDPWALSFSLFGLNLNSEISYDKYFMGVSWTRPSYMLHNRVIDKERVYFEDKKVFVGFRFMMFEFQSGLSFDRQTYIGTSSLNQSGGKLNLKPEQFLSASFKWSI